MPAYVIVDVHITDHETYEQYKKLTPASVSAFGGKFVVRGGKAETIEGDWEPGRIVILEFADIETAHKWWNSDIYTTAKKIRQRSAITKMIFVEGIAAAGV